jgi:hypothetical protein
MLRAFPLLAMVVVGCVLDSGEERRPEILPGRYRAAQDSIVAEYEFHADGNFSFVRRVSGRPDLTETGKWEYRYVGPEERYLVESEVTRRDLGSDLVWRERENLGYQYRIEASSPRKFHLNPGDDDFHGGMLLIFLLFGGSGHVVFHRL